MSISTKFTQADLIAALNKSLDLPFVSEEYEGVLIERALGQIIDYIPPVLWPVIADATLSFDQALLQKTLDALTNLIVDNVSVPGLPKSTLRMLITALMNAIAEAAQHGLHMSAITELVTKKV